MTKVAACIATKDRPRSLERLFTTLAEQTRPYDVVVVIDASSDGATRDVCDAFASKLSVRYEHSAPGLPLQRRKAIDIVLADNEIDHVCFMDDDIVVDAAFNATITEFLDADGSRTFAGVSGYDDEEWGKPFSSLDRLYSRLRIFDGPLVAGRWLYCGHFLELEQLPVDTAGVHRCDFLRGGFTTWRKSVFEEFEQPLAMTGYALAEDKHFSLRVASKHALCVHPGARVRHLHEPGGRPSRTKLAFRRLRAHALLLRDCDPSPSWLRYAAFVAFSALDVAVQLVWRVVRGRFGELDTVFASAAGTISCAIYPPRRTAAALHT
jgi:GT2 family glycosyltransferase